MPDHATAAQISESWNGQSGWRWMFAACAVPSLLFFLFSMLIPESPRWLAKSGDSVKTFKVLVKIGESQYAQEELLQIETSLENEIGKVHFHELLDKVIVKILA